MDDPYRVIEETRRRALYQRSEFTFSCRRCGKCCVTITGLGLSPYDVFLLSTELGYTQREFITGHCELDTSQGMIPSILLRVEQGRCPFYDEAKGCTVYHVRPFVCASFPIGYLYDGDKREAAYFPKNGYGCLDRGEIYTLGQWLSSIRTITDAHFNWFLDYVDLNCELDAAGRKGNAAVMQSEEVSMAIMHLIAKYRHDEPFPAQYRKNKQMLRKAIRKLQK